MWLYTTCRDCGGALHTTDQDTAHPSCTPRLTPVEKLCEEFVAAVEADDDELAGRLEAQVDEFKNRPPRLGEAAVAYTLWGWPVFPLKPRSKTPATPHGFKDATSDGERVKRWWGRHPDCNIGLATGQCFDVVDVDPPDGPRSLDLLLAAVDAAGRGPLPDCHGRVQTPSGGTHLYVEVMGSPNSTRLMPGIDIRGAGGYVVAPPSLRGDGKQWFWGMHPSPRIKKSS